MDVATSAEREILVRRLTEDLIGPFEKDELLHDYPSDTYQTGILWPKDTRMSAEDDEKLGNDEEDDNSPGGDAEAVPASIMFRPSTAGLSFAVGGTDITRLINVNVIFARYNPMENEEQGPSISDKKTGNKKPRWDWKRQPFEICILGLDLKNLNYPKMSLAEFGAPDGLFLHARIIPWNDAGDEKNLVTLTLINESAPADVRDRDVLESYTLFQVRIQVTTATDTVLVPRPPRRSVIPDQVSEEKLSAALLYRDQREFAVGHTCSAEWLEGKDPGCAAWVATTWIPRAGVSAVSSQGHKVFSSTKNSDTMPVLSARWLSLATDHDLGKALIQLPEAYGTWIDIQDKTIPELPNEYQEQARRNIDRCRKVQERMTIGADLIAKDPKVAESFRLSNKAMHMQHGWDPEKRKKPLEWRPFQLGFVLLTIHSLADRKHPDRNITDLLWFPTGGGKTEAYLALIAFIAFYRRFTLEKITDSETGVAAIMRYTLRLLTTQQFIRASAMILACEKIRREHKGIPFRIGEVPFSIGLWVGKDATPNKFEDAADALKTDGFVTPAQLTDCPACQKTLRWYVDYKEKLIRVKCENKECDLYHSSESLPVYTVDENIYVKKPTLLIATIDKFAQIVRNKEIHNLFSISHGSPPDLIIQDELHLISGPLGTIAGLYETAIDRMFTREGMRPKVVGSTATIRRADEQVRALFDRGLCQFPPSAINADDSGFAVIDTQIPERLYLGITTSGRSAKFMLRAVAASLLQSAEGGLSSHGARNNYWTLVSYFNSLRELGGALVLMQDDVNDALRDLSVRRGEDQRTPYEIEELTSRKSQEEIKIMLKRLNIPADQPGVLDVVLASNMMSVGVDIPRLGIMLVNGQPKGISEYIQATSRVGRGNVPGLVISVLNNAKIRDRSHYESFVTWHSTLYRDVEATSVTPFASRARDRALPAVLVTLIRHMVPGMLENPDLSRVTDKDIQMITDYIITRAASVDPEEYAVKNDLIWLLNKWSIRRPRYYWNSYRSAESLMQDAETAAAHRALGQRQGHAWSTMNNMRSVEAACLFAAPERHDRRRTNVSGNHD